MSVIERIAEEIAARWGVVVSSNAALLAVSNMGVNTALQTVVLVLSIVLTTLAVIEKGRKVLGKKRESEDTTRFEKK